MRDIVLLQNTHQWSRIPHFFLGAWFLFEIRQLFIHLSHNSFIYISMIVHIRIHYSNPSSTTPHTTNGTNNETVESERTIKLHTLYNNVITYHQRRL
mmetsp:Transcript_864/g.1614  ORF Transcript_864/g.1614 Transcript_864/m.1614 type:complete len:97 (+) Transcript_864:427-717(+)